MDDRDEPFQAEVREMRRPGEWLRACAAKVCCMRTMERLIDPIVSDLQSEYEEARRTGQPRRAAWIRAAGYSGFWKAVGLHAVESASRATGNVIMSGAVAMSRTIVIAFVAFLVITTLLVMPPLLDKASEPLLGSPTLILFLIPQAIPLSIPVALALGVLLGRGNGGGTRLTRGIVLLALAGTTVAFVTQMWGVPEANQAWRVAVAREHGARGIDKDSLPRGLNEMPLSMLAAGIREYEAGGFPEEAAKFRFSYHLRFALPAATFVLALLALGIRGAIRSRALGIAAFLISLCAYYMCLSLSDAAKSFVPQVASLWAPNILFTALSLTLLRTSAHRATT